MHPVVVAEHDEGVSAGNAIVFLIEDASESRTHAQDIEVVAGNEFARAALGLAAAGDAGGEGITGEHAGEHVVVVAQSLVDAIRKGFRVIAIVRDVPGYRPRGA